MYLPRRRLGVLCSGTTTPTNDHHENLLKMRPYDTDPAAHQAQMRVYRLMGPEARVRLAFEMSEDVRRIALEGIRSRHPEYDDHQARRALFRLLFGEDLVRTIWPNEASVAP